MFSKKIIYNIEQAFGDRLDIVFLSNEFHLKRIGILAKQNKVKKFELISAEAELQNIYIEDKNEKFITLLTRFGFGPLITFAAKRRRMNN